MLIEIRAIDFPLTDAIYLHVESRIESSLGAFSRRVLSVTVRLEDLNAGRGGIDKRCSIVTALRRNSAMVIAEATHEDLYAAVDRAAERARRSVGRRLARHLDLQRKDVQRPGALVTL